MPISRLVASLLAGGLALATESTQKEKPATQSVVLEVGLQHEIEIGDEIDPGDQLRFFVVTLRLVNRGKEPVYVRPVIGELGGLLKLEARRAGSSERPSILYYYESMKPAFDIEDLFKLMPGRSLERRMELTYPKSPHLPEEGWVEVWAEYDCRAMKEADERAFGALLKSEAVGVPVKRFVGGRRPMHSGEKLAIVGLAVSLALLPAEVARAQSCPLSCMQAPTPTTAPGGDTPDDNVSSASPSSVSSALPTPAEPTSGERSVKAGTAVLVSGFWDRTLAVLQTVGAEAVTIPMERLGGSGKEIPTLVLSSGSLTETADSEHVRIALADYVSRGNALLVFSQQRGADFSILPTPDGRPIRGWGWHEDNSCYTNGAYIDTFHPMLASQSTALVTSNLDGYFDSIPENAIVLLRRVKNGLPTMFMYPYGQGWVVVSSSYDDWGGFNQEQPGRAGDHP